VVAAGGIYHFLFHPYCFDISELTPHFDYIKEKTNLWYAGFGHLYLYDFTRQQASQKVTFLGNNVYLYYGKSGVTSFSNYDSVFSKDYDEQGLAGLWHMDEGTPGNEILVDGGLETWTDTITPANWTTDGVLTDARGITQEATIKQNGSSALKLSATSSDGTNFGVYQNIATTGNTDYQVNFYQYYAVRDATANTGTLKIEAYDNTNSVSLGSQSIITQGADLSYTSFRFTTAASTVSVRIKIYLNTETTGVAYIDSLSVKQSSKTLTDSAGINTGTIYGASRISTDGGQWGARSDVVFSQGSALRFDGKDDYVNVGNNASLQLTTAFTLSAWVKYKGTSTSGSLNSIIDKGRVGWVLPCNGFRMGYDTNFSRWNFSVGDSDTQYDWVLFTQPYAEVFDTYHFITATFDSGTMNLYVDGILESSKISTTVTNVDATISNLKIGAYSTSDLHYFNGIIDEARVYNRVLNAQEVSTQYQRKKYVYSEPSFTSTAIRSYSTLFKSTINTISSTDNISYSSDPAVSNLVNSDISFTPPIGSIDVTLTDTAASANYTNSTLPGLSAANLDRETDFNNNGTTSLKITPSSDSVDIDFDTWQTSDDYYKKWTESSTTHGVNTSHTIGDLKPNTYYALEVDTVNQDTYLSDDSGQITFTYSGGYSTHTFEITEDTNGPTSFTLVSPANNASTSNRTPTFSWNASSDTESNLSKYQLYIDGVMDKDNISNTSTNTSPTTELSCADHSWYVKAIDNAGNSTDSNIFSLNINCSGVFIPPTKPNITNIDITVLDNGNLTFDNLPDSITQIAISLTPDFTNASWEDISKKEELFQRYAGADKLYIKFRTDQGAVSDVITCEGGNVSITEGTDTGDTNNQGSNTQPLNDGDIVKTSNSPDVYIIKYKNNKQYKRLILAPYVFNLYGHLKWENIKTIPQSQLDQFTISNLIKETLDSIIYQFFPDGDTGKRKPLDTSTPYDPDSTYEINKPEQDSYESIN